MATQQVNLYSPWVSNRKNWTEAVRVERVMQATGKTGRGEMALPVSALKAVQ